MSPINILLSTICGLSPIQERVAPKSLAPLSLPSLPLTLRVQTELPNGTVAALETEMEALFSPLGVRFRLRRPAQSALATVLLRSRPKVRRITGCSRNLHDHRLGLAQLDRRFVVLWRDQIIRGTRGDWDGRRLPRLGGALLGRAMGRVLAHELVHLFLRLDGHRPGGLMRPTFRHRDLSRSTSRGLQLSSADVQKLQKRLRTLASTSH